MLHEHRHNILVSVLRNLHKSTQGRLRFGSCFVEDCLVSRSYTLSTGVTSRGTRGSFIQNNHCSRLMAALRSRGPSPFRKHHTHNRACPSPYLPSRARSASSVWWTGNSGQPETPGSHTTHPYRSSAVETHTAQHPQSLAQGGGFSSSRSRSGLPTRLPTWFSPAGWWPDGACLCGCWQPAGAFSPAWPLPYGDAGTDHRGTPLLTAGNRALQTLDLAQRILERMRVLDLGSITHRPQPCDAQVYPRYWLSCHLRVWDL